MTILESYIFGRAIRMFLAVLLPVLAIVWLVQVLGRINLVTDSGQSIGSFLLLSAYLLPSVVPVVLPFAVAIGVTQTLQTMNSDSERAVIDAAGTPRKTIVKPMVLLASLACILSFSINNFLEPVTRLGLRQTVAATYADLLSSVIEEKVFRKLDDGLFVQISERVQGRVLRGLFVSDSRDPNYDMIYYAREGAVDKNGETLIMKDGEIHRKLKTGNLSVIHFDSYAFDLSDLTATRGQMRLKAADRDLAFLFNPDPADPQVKDHPLDFREELHRRLTDWILPLAFTLFSILAVGNAHSVRQKGIHPLFSALALAFLYRWATFFAAGRIGSDTGGPLTLYILIIAPIGLAVLALAHQSRKLARKSILEGVVDRVGEVLGRRFRAERDKAGG